MAYLIDWTTLENYQRQLSENKTVNNVGEYNYKVIPGLSIEIDCEIGAKYLVISNASMLPSTSAETYLRNVLDGNMISTSVSHVGQAYEQLTTVAIFTATNNTHLIESFTGTGGASSASVTIIRSSSLIIIRIG